jgi:hypothetical protein
MSDQLIADRPRITTAISRYFLLERDQCWVSSQLSAQIVQELQGCHRDGMHRSLLSSVPVRECINNNVCGARLVLHPEIKVEKLAYPLVLRGRRESLVQ